MPSLVYLPMNFRIYMSRVHVYGWTSAWIKSPPRTWSSIQHQQEGLVGQIMKHEVEVSGCSGADNYSPMTNSFVIHLTQVPPQLGWLYKWEWALDWYVNLNIALQERESALIGFPLLEEDGQLVKSSNIALDKEWPQKTFIWPHAPLNNNVV